MQAGWKPSDDIQVEIIPGSIALSACASLVGAPLTHDFCSIFLSDLLTPWPVIARPIEAAGHADFVVALYNHKSGRRTQQIVQAQAILLRYRRPDTPVAIVKSAYRRRQSIQLVRLDEMAECDIGMLTTVLIGNSSTFIKEGLMITPRGYANKYSSLTGAEKDGEQAGISLTMGLEGWYACLREYVQETPGLTLEKIADYFGVAVGEVLNAIAAGESAGEHKAARIQTDKLNEVIMSCETWGRLRGIVRAAASAVSELFLQAKDFQLRGEWLNIETEAVHFHINWHKIDSAYLACREGKSYGVNFIDNKGHLVFRLLLTKENGEFSAAKLEAYSQTWQALTEEQNNA